jgi:hypothetical protein
MRKQTMCRFHMERFSLKKLNEVEGKECCRVEMSNRFPSLENLYSEVNTKMYWKVRTNVCQRKSRLL